MLGSAMDGTPRQVARETDQSKTWNAQHAFGDHKSTTPSSVIFNQTKLCSCMYNVDIDKFQTDLVALQSKDITKHFHKK